jgi:hypothetical protein
MAMGKLAIAWNGGTLAARSAGPRRRVMPAR